MPSLTTRRGPFCFPLEIELTIIDNVHDKATLSLCSLVCSDWRDIARRELFREIVVKARRGSGSFHAFFNMLETCAPPGLGSNVLSLDLVGIAPEEGSQTDGSDDEDMTQLPLTLLRQLLSQLPGLRSLSLTYVMFSSGSESNDPDHAFPKISLAAPVSLETLDIHLCTAQDGDVRLLGDAICLFSDIGDLWIYHLRGFKTMPDRERVDTPTFHLLNIQHVDKPCIALISAIAAPLPNASSLSGFEVAAGNRREMAGVSHLLRTLPGPETSICEMALNFVGLIVDRGDRPSWGYLAWWHILPLDRYPKLERLTLELHAEDYWRPTGRCTYEPIHRVPYLEVALQWCADVLNVSVVYGVPTLREVILRMDVPGLLAFEILTLARKRRSKRSPWKALDMVLAQYPALERVDFIVCGSMEGMTPAIVKAIWSCIRARMPHTYRRGILRAYFFNTSFEPVPHHVDLYSSSGRILEDVPPAIEVEELFSDFWALSCNDDLE